MRFLSSNVQIIRAKRGDELQGTYYVTSGLWPILHMSSFEKVTGRKGDKWLVKTVGALITAIGSTLLFSASRASQ